MQDAGLESRQRKFSTRSLAGPKRVSTSRGEDGWNLSRIDILFVCVTFLLTTAPASPSICEGLASGQFWRANRAFAQGGDVTAKEEFEVKKLGDGGEAAASVAPSKSAAPSAPTTAAPTASGPKALSRSGEPEGDRPRGPKV